ncbi:NADH-FMN oxidoreductase RutF, flavin reductase (DIM6/NTAB) family [Geoalkalibacter ferrihydriticus]|uniref:Flavin reductase like domain-containing protein n=2 Tax=Geoalkalibacter ferrihydriticus TaxID=392333 RepID=A0A0C2HLN8_9BACT|nr:hypothetical protein [Geoalkalibacter ferrihydriticus]KIH78031.1 hypothetical protein GFER_05405 [Geoalkalibacter ferrihydriticus DSM 17813]SDM32378.1 NADH-FMN oxidoreductase RutF, flavin reductase (DIM6/NTAB) family [Geoalkalibacter ferrihydriticus]
MPIKSLFSLYPQLMACPLALVSWKGEAGQVCWEIVEWVGVVCDRPSRLSFNLLDGGLVRAGDFAVSLPDDDRLCRLRESLALRGGSSDKCLDEKLAFESSSAAEPPILAGCPVTFACSLQDARKSYGRFQVCGLVQDVRIHGREYRTDTGADVCALQPFHRRWFHATTGAEPQIS